MGLETKPEDRKVKIANLREKHQPVFDALGIPDAVFIPKFAYMHKPGAHEKIIAFFPSEISKGNDVYTEFVSIDYDPEDAERRLWKWKFNPEYETEYERSEPHKVTGHPRYLIPVGELVEVKMPSKENNNGSAQKNTTLEFPLMDPDQDAPYSEMTLRDYAAIHLRKPVSHKEWLNNIIKQG